MSGVKWGIVGCGAVCEVKSGPAYQETEDFKVSAVMRRNLASAKDFAMRHGVEHFCSDAENLIQHPSVDAVYIATPPDSHKAYALMVAEAGKPCCIEKPMATNYADCREISEVFSARKIPLFVAYYRRSLPRFRKVQQWLLENRIGTPRVVHWHLEKPASKRDLAKQSNWRTDSRVAYAGYFDDLASHGLDLLIYLLGEITEAKGISLNQQGLYSAKDTVSACWLHRSGVSGSGSWNFGSDRASDIVEIVGSHGRIRFSVFGDTPLVFEHDGTREQVDIANPETIQIHHVENMRNTLLYGAPHPSTGETAAHTAWVMDKILDRI